MATIPEGAAHAALLHDPVAGTTRKVDVCLVLDPGPALLVRERDGAGERVVRRDDLRGATAGFNGESIALSWEEDGRQWAVSIAAIDASGWAAPLLGPPLANKIAGIRSAHARSSRWGRVALAAAALAGASLLAGIAAAFFFRDPILDAILKRLPLAIDRQIGEATHKSVVASGRLVAAGPAPAAVQALGERLAAVAATPMGGVDGGEPFAFRFLVVTDPSVNAYAAPGGLVVVHTGLIAEAASAAELAGVLAHEITHVTERHSMRQILVTLGIGSTLTLLMGSPDGAGSVVAGIAGKLSELSFSRAQELSADRGGLELLVRARLPADGLERFFARLDATGAALPALLSTHPSGGDRAERLRAAIAAHPPWTVDPPAVDWDAVRAAVGAPAAAAERAAEASR